MSTVFYLGCSSTDDMVTGAGTGTIDIDSTVTKLSKTYSFFKLEAKQLAWQYI